MSPKQTRASVIIAGLIFLSLALGLILTSLEKHIVFFYSPSEITDNPPIKDKKIRVGGLVKEGSITRLDLTTDFIITDTAHDITIRHHGILPDLFREGQGIVAEGHFNQSGVFIAHTVLAKHDETYMPPEIADALKASGHWRDNNDPDNVKEK